MKKIGIVGGVGWRATADYYARLYGRYSQSTGPIPRPAPEMLHEMTIESLDLRKAVALLGHGNDARSWRAFEHYHAQAIRRLVVAGAEVALMASNTPHERFEAITRGIEIPVIDLFAAVAAAAQRAGFKSMVVLGTAVTMLRTSSPIVCRARGEGASAHACSL
jgi:aspartate racemase